MIYAILAGMFFAVMDLIDFRSEDDIGFPINLVPEDWWVGGTNVLWLPVDLWHVSKILAITTLILSGYFAKTWLDVPLNILITLTSFTFFYHFGFVKNKRAELKRWWNLYWKRKQLN